LCAAEREILLENPAGYRVKQPSIPDANKPRGEKHSTHLHVHLTESCCRDSHAAQRRSLRRFALGRGLTLRMTRRYIRNPYAPGADTSQVLHSNSGQMQMKCSERLVRCRTSRDSRRQRSGLGYVDRFPHCPSNHQHCC
jgi:hypothetical protein